MGYTCPVCEDPQADAGHLANHLAFTAILGDEAHGAWLDDHVPGWGELDETELADALRDDVDEAEYPQVFEDTVGGLSESESPVERSGALFEDASSGSESGREHDHWPGDRRDGPPGGGPGDAPDVAPVEPADPADEETAAILAEAREMTREMMGVDEAGPDEGDVHDSTTDDGTPVDETATDDVNRDDDSATDDGTPGDATATDDDGGEGCGDGQDRADAADETDGNENE